MVKKKNPSKVKNHTNHDSNVIHIDFQSKIRKPVTTSTNTSKSQTPKLNFMGLSGKNRSKKVTKTSTVIDLLPKINEEKRKKSRIVMSGFMNTAIVAPQGLIKQVSLYDISETGISFDLPLSHSGVFKFNQELRMRVYLNPENFFDFNILITKNIRDIPEEGVCRYGSKLLTNGRNEKAVNNLIHFIESVTNIINKDKGEVLLYK